MSDATSEPPRPAGADVLVTVHPALPPAIAMAMFVSPADQAHIDAAYARSIELAVQRGHIRRF